MDKIFQYTDYRQYLKAYYDFKKETTSYFSYRYFSLKAGINSPSFLKSVVEGKRNLSKVSTEKFIQGLGHSEKEAQYFRVLILFNQSSVPEEKQQFYTQMLAMSDFVNDTKLSSNQYQYLKNWYTPVIRELVSYFDFENDFQLLADAVFPPITENAAKRSFEFLLKSKLIKKSPAGLYNQTNRALTSGKDHPETLGLVRRNYHKQMIQKAADSLDEVSIEERLAMGISVGISKTGYDVLLSEIAAFRERIITLVDKDQATHRTYQFNIQLFPTSFGLDEIHERSEK